MCNNSIIFIFFFNKNLIIFYFYTRLKFNITCNIENDRYIIAVILTSTNKRYNILPEFDIWLILSYS